MARRGFTLLELVLALVLLALGTGLATASLAGLRDGAAAGDAAERLVLLGERARRLAVHEGAPVRLRIDPEAATAALAVLRPEGEAASGDPLALGEPGRLAISAGTGTDLLFLPDGRCDSPGTVIVDQGGWRRQVRFPAGALPPIASPAEDAEATP